MKRPTETTGPVVLVIDDDDVGRCLIRESLPPGSKVIELSSPIGATRAATDGKVDVVVLDLEMPNLRGDSLTQLFRNNARLRNVGVVLVSGCRTEEIAELGRRSGADDWLSKADLRAQLASVVIRVCRAVRVRGLRASSGDPSLRPPGTELRTATRDKGG